MKKGSLSLMGAQLVIPQGTVEAGGTLHGTLKFKLEKPIENRKGLVIKLVGKEISRQRIGPQKDQHKWGRANVHKQHITILDGPKNAGYATHLPPGDYSFPFSFHIPIDAPPSLNVGYIREDPGFVQEQVPGGGVIYTVQAKAGGLVYRHRQKWFMLRVRSNIAIVSHMPTSQYLTKAPVESTPSHFDRTSCCCCIDNGRTEIHVKLPQNIYIFGKDASISGTMFINNSESGSPCHNLGVRLVQTVTKQLHGQQVKYSDLSTRLQLDVKGADIAPGEQQLKQFDFVLPLPQYRRALSTCYNGPSFTAFYELVVTIGGQHVHSMPILMASGEDPTNRSPPIDMAVPRNVIAPGAYPRFIYPHGQVADAVMPQQPPAHIPQPTPQRPPANFMPSVNSFHASRGDGSDGLHSGTGAMFSESPAAAITEAPSTNPHNNVYAGCGPANSDIIERGVQIESDFNMAQSSIY